MISNIWAKTQAAWHSWTMSPDDKFLNASTDHADLERRQQVLARKGLPSHWH